jgi:hypothetical protein
MRSLFIIIFQLSLSLLFSQNKQKIIIDTDGGIDDLRAINYILATNDFEILGITTNDGALSPTETYIKVQALLRHHQIKNIPVAVGKSILETPPPWRKMSQELFWGDEKNIIINTSIPATQLLIDIISGNNDVKILCLGPLTNIAETFNNDPYLKQNIQFPLLWYNPGIALNEGIYYKDDIQSFNQIINLNIPIFAIHNGNLSGYAFDASFLNKIKLKKSEFASIIAKSHYAEGVYFKVATAHFQLWDDLIFVFMKHPEWFEAIKNETIPLVTDITPQKGKPYSKKIKKSILKVL